MKPTIKSDVPIGQVPGDRNPREVLIEEVEIELNQSGVNEDTKGKVAKASVLKVPPVTTIDGFEKGASQKTVPLPSLDDLKSSLPADTLADLKAECTDKQVDFALLVAHGVPYNRAYEAAYDVGEDTKENTKATAGWRIAHSNTIKWALALIHRSSVTASLMRGGRNLDTPDVVREWILSRLAKEADNDKENTGSVRVRSLELLGRAYGVFGDENPTKTHSADLGDAEEKLDKLLARARTINSTTQDPEVIDADVVSESN